MTFPLYIAAKDKTWFLAINDEYRFIRIDKTLPDTGSNPAGIKGVQSKNRYQRETTWCFQFGIHHEIEFRKYNEEREQHEHEYLERLFDRWKTGKGSCEIITSDQFFDELDKLDQNMRAFREFILDSAKVKIVTTDENIETPIFLEDAPPVKEQFDATTAWYNQEKDNEPLETAPF